MGPRARGGRGGDTGAVGDFNASAASSNAWMGKPRGEGESKGRRSTRVLSWRWNNALCLVGVVAVPSDGEGDVDERWWWWWWWWWWCVLCRDGDLDLERDLDLESLLWW